MKDTKRTTCKIGQCGKTWQGFQGGPTMSVNGEYFRLRPRKVDEVKGNFIQGLRPYLAYLSVCKFSSRCRSSTY